MGRIVIPIGIDLDDIKNVFGSKDVLLFNAILQSNFYKKFDEDFSFKKELTDIIFNYVPFENRVVKPSKFFGLLKGDDNRGLEGEWNDYGYALLTLCCHLGEKFSDNEKEFTYADSWWNINTLLRQNGSEIDLSRMLESAQVFDTPFFQEDIYTNYFSKSEVIEFLRQLLIIEDQIEKEHSGFFYSLKAGLLKCKKKNQDVVIFSYE